MNRFEMEKEIEDNIIGIGYKNEDSTLNEEGKVLKDIYLAELNLDTNLINNEKYREKLTNIYINRIEKQKININFQKEKITTLISTVSFTRINDNILDELPIEKSLRIFNNIKNIYLFHTKAAIENYLKIKEKLTKNGYNVIGEEVDETLTEIRKYLHKILREELNKDETIVDITAGIKISSISMYKFAVENGIRAINWKEIQLPRYNSNTYEKEERTDRIVFSTRLEILKEALEESRQILTDINDALDREEYAILARYYDKLDRKDEAFFFENLAKLFNLENFLALDSENFYKQLKEFLDNILSYRNFDKNISDKIRPFILLLKVISDTDEDGKFDEKFLDKDDDSDFLMNYYEEEMKKFKIVDGDFVDYSLLMEDQDQEDQDQDEDDNSQKFLKKRELYYYLALKFLERKYSDTNLEGNILDSIKRKVLEHLKTSEFEKFEEELERNGISFEIFYENLFEKYNSEPELKNILNLFNIKEKFEEILTKPATFVDENIFRLEDYNIEIDFQKDIEINHKVYREILKRLLETKNYSIKKTDLKKIEYFKELNKKDGKKVSTFETKISTFKNKFCKKLNEVIRRKIGEEVEDFIMVEELKNENDTLYKINEKFL